MRHQKISTTICLVIIFGGIIFGIAKFSGDAVSATHDAIMYS